MRRTATPPIHRTNAVRSSNPFVGLWSTSEPWSWSLVSLLPENYPSQPYSFLLSTPVAIDNIALTTVPEPSTVLLFGSAAMGLLLWREKSLRVSSL
jgi:hypothetical protein